MVPDSPLNAELALGIEPAAPRAEEVAPEAPLPYAQVGELFAAVDKALRSQRLYQPNNPVYRGFITTAQRAVAGLWDDIQSFTVSVEETGFRWYGRLFPVGEGRETVPFLLYKDGVRFLTLLPGFEDEFERFLDVINRARSLDKASDDDMVTLLWQQEFTSLQYSYVDALSEGLQLPGSTTPKLAGVELTLVQRDASSPPRRSPTPRPEASSEEAPRGIIRADDFEETLYFLDQTELATLRHELELELERDLKGDVLNALFDRLEDGYPEWRVEVVRVLRQLLPVYLGSGDLASAARILLELSRLLEIGTVTGEASAEAEALFEELSEPAVLSQFMTSLHDGSIDPDSDDLGVFLRYLGPAAMPVLLAAIERSEPGPLQDRLRAAMEGLGGTHRDRLVALLRDADAYVVRGAARLTGRLGIAEAVRPLAELLQLPEPLMRRAAVDALVRIRSTAAMDALQHALIDEDREIRIAAARGLGSLRYPPARAALEKMLEHRIVREADLTEKIAYFEACAVIGGDDSVALFDRILNGRRLLGRESPEMRACAALALGRVGSPSARAALERAADDSNPVVRTAVGKALRKEAQ
jgi:hypothetical protein